VGVVSLRASLSPEPRLEIRQDLGHHGTKTPNQKKKAHAHITHASKLAPKHSGYVLPAADRPFGDRNDIEAFIGAESVSIGEAVDALL
jgi:hypothetical protein